MPSLIPDNAGAVMAGFGAAITLAAGKAIKLSAALEMNKISFTTMLGSAQAADAMLNKLATLAAGSPFGFNELVESSKKMLGLGVAAQNVLPWLTTIGDTVSAFGGGTAQVQSISDAFAKMLAQGTMAADQMNRLSDAGVPGWKLLAEVLNVDVATAMKMAEQKSIDTGSAIQGMMDKMSTRYAGSMQKASNTVTGQLSNMGDVATQIATKMGTSISKGLDLTSALGKANKQLDEFSQRIDSVGITKAMTDLIPDQVIVASMTAVTAYSAARFIPAMAAIRNAFLSARIAAIAFSASLGPLGWAVVGLTAVGTELYIQSQKTENQLELLNVAIEQEANYMSDTNEEANTLINKLREITGAAKMAEDQLAKVAGMADFRRSEDTNILPAIVPTSPPPGGGGGQTEKEARQIVRAQADYEIAVARDKASLLIDTIKSQEEEMDRQRKNGLSGVREYWSKRETEDANGLAVIKAYWDKRNSLEISGVNAELDALKKEKTAIESQIAETSDPSETIALKRELLGVTTDITLKERELGTVLKNNTQLAADESMSFITKYAELLNSTKKTMADMNTSNAMQGLKGSAKGYAEIENEKITRLKAVQDVVDGWSKGFATIKDEYGVTITDTVEMEKWRAQQNEAINIQSLDRKNEYYQTASDIRADIDAAYRANSLTALRAALTAENAIRLSNYEAQQTMMETWQSAYLAAHSTTAQLVADLYAGAFDGLQTAISGMLDGTKTVSDAFTELGKTMLKVVTDYVAQWLAGRIMMAIFGESTMATETAAGVAAGAAMAAAWAPAAAAVSLATFGANAGPAIAGITAANVTAMGFAIPALASGGITTGPTLAEIGEGKYKEAVLPLNKKVFERLGLTGGSAGGPSNQLIMNIHALDGKSVERWLESSGGRKIKRYFASQAREFVPAEV
jgi:tape measure domain-containing protein